MTDISLILPSTGDPLVTYIWLKNYQKYRHLVDNIFISVDFMNIPVRDDRTVVTDYLTDIFEKNSITEYTFSSGISQHGLNIEYLLKTYKNKFKNNILLMEEDEYICDVSRFDSLLKSHIQNTFDVTANSFALSLPLISDALKRHMVRRDDLHLYKNDVLMNNADVAPFVCWPTTFIAKTEHYMESGFHSKNWNKGDIINIGDEDIIANDLCCGDTFVNFSMELVLNPNVKKINFIDLCCRSNLCDDIIMAGSVRLCESSLNFHIGGYSAIFRHRLWLNTIDEELDFLYSRMKNSKLSSTADYSFLHHYKTLIILNEYLNVINSDEFYFYENYKRNLSTLLNLFEGEYNAPGKLFEVDSRISTGLNKNMYSRIARNTI